MTSSADQVDATTAPAPRLPWYTLNPRALGRMQLLRAVLIGLCVVSITIAPVWRLAWYYPLLSAKNFSSVRDSHGVRRAAWRWIFGKEIRIYATPDVSDRVLARITDGVQEMVDESQLDMRVVVMPMPANVAQAYEASLVTRTLWGEPRQCLSFDGLASRLIELRDGDPHADILLVNTPFTEAAWAQGMAMFSNGVAVMQADSATEHLGKHETCHLLGYMSHDSFPLYVIGYAGEGSPNRDTLMMLHSQSMNLSPRAADALHHFWRGVEQRSGKRFLKV